MKSLKMFNLINALLPNKLFELVKYFLKMLKITARFLGFYAFFSINIDNNI